ncbi:MAG: hypothetical protein H5T42_01400 [Methanothrix sp.]|jgi:hypothetical protein|uniref:DUF4352 domain-containing protein n=1 Tax=Methanothrix thermoacetophila (strain DSM 6194 / JCM 14653 / NBRC 101360 / PT) TaxID=349307 RepID=A0B7D1_METTP|nr:MULTISPECIES: hypothetical protein [Methanothrix]ABK14605.1 hypothetical protein Mthe_0816 [Methanothrix thermoacetophila PT]MBC7079125.1 hypothetical protein [Methanothrix sp.]NPU87281.1 hypothetical protein [Methanothrix sp.]
MNAIRSIWPLVLIMGLIAASHAYPIQGSNGAVTCVVFDGYKSRYDMNTSALFLDVGMTRGINVTFEVVDQNNNTYPVDINHSRALQPGRFSLVFMLPMSSDAAYLTVIPEGSNPFSIAWDKPLKYTNGIANLRYYGITDWLLSNTSQTISVDISLSNNATEGEIVMSPENFTLVDQWGWRYFADATFSPVIIPPKSILRKEITFASISPRSRPALLEYDFATDHPIQIPLDTSLIEIQMSMPSESPAETHTEAAAPTARVNETTNVTQTLPQPPQLEQKPMTTQEKVLAARERLASVQEMMRKK